MSDFTTDVGWCATETRGTIARSSEPSDGRENGMRRSIASFVLVGLWLLPTAIAEATPPHVGCPPAASGYQPWGVSTEPYQADDLVDTNGDGWVCARPIGDQTFELEGQTYPLYNFIDDVVPR